VGKHNVHEIVEKAGIDPRKKIKDLSETEVGHLREILDRDYQVEGDLRREVQGNIRRLMEIGCYRGIRHRRGLPTRGQRTRSNARTRKGKPKTVAGKKKVKK
jgi:small subunit ribosomal protein S13